MNNTLEILKESLWRQFGASIDMLENAINLVPDDLWTTDKKFFYQAYHCLIFLDYYLTMPGENFSSPLPFTITDREQIPTDAIDDVVPDKIYQKSELIEYLNASREKCRNMIDGLTEENLEARWVETDGDMDYVFIELLLYNMRHVQHHAAQMNLLLRQRIDQAPKWVSRARSGL